MKKEITLVITACLFLLAYVLDYFAGALKLTILSPIQFIDASYFKLYPMTYVSVVVRSIALMLSVTLFLSMMERQYFKKLGIVFFLGFVSEIYAFQILATGSTITPVLWTLAISYSGVLLLIPMAFYFFLGIANFLIPPAKNTTPLVRHEESETNNSSSVLNP